MTTSDQTTPEPSAHSPTVASILDGLPALAAAAGADPPQAGTTMPQIEIGSFVLSRVATEIGMLLSIAPIFHDGNGYVTANESTGTLDPLRPDEFCGWVEQYATFYKQRGEERRPQSMKREQAAQLLAAPQFRRHIRPVKGLQRVRLPVWRIIDGKRTVELLPAGYDVPTGILTLPELDYATDMEPDAARAFLLQTLAEFPFTREDKAPLEQCRSFAVHIAATVGQYVREMLPPSAAQPIIIYNANQPGSGKGHLVQLALCPMHGEISLPEAPHKDEELQKLLDSVALSKLPFYVLDEVKILPGGVNAFVTSPVRSARKMGTQTIVKAKCMTQLFAAGNNIRFAQSDLTRRCLIADLFLAREASSREFKFEITPGWIAAPETRQQFLSALWALVRWWCENGQPTDKEARHNSAPEWARLVGSIVSTAKLGNAFAKREETVGGDERKVAIEMVLSAILSDLPGTTMAIITPQDFLDKAEDLSLTDAILPYAPKDERKAIGNALKPLRGREVTDTKGRWWTFGRREVGEGVNYTCRLATSGNASTS